MIIMVGLFQNSKIRLRGRVVYNSMFSYLSNWQIQNHENKCQLSLGQSSGFAIAWTRVGVASNSIFSYFHKETDKIKTKTKIEWICNWRLRVRIACAVQWTMWFSNYTSLEMHSFIVQSPWNVQFLWNVLFLWNLLFWNALVDNVVYLHSFTVFSRKTDSSLSLFNGSVTCEQMQTNSCVLAEFNLL